MTNAFSKPVVFLSTTPEESCFQRMETNLDGLVRSIITASPRSENTPEVLGKISRTQAIEWAAKAWKTVWIALMGRSQRSTWLKHPLDASPAQAFIERLAERCVLEQAIPWLKFHTTYLFALHAHQTDLPICPAFCQSEIPGILGGGWVYTRCHRLMQGRPEDFGAALDILYSKYGMPKAPEAFILKSLDDHRRVLSTEVDEPVTSVPVKNVDEVVCDIDLRIGDALKAQVKEIVDSAFAGKVYKPRICVPSQSACFELGTARGGQLECLRRAFNESRRTPSTAELFERACEEPLLQSMKEVLPGVVKVERDSPVRQLMVDRFLVWAREDAYSKRMSPLCARQFGIPEPLKVRVILEGESSPIYFVTSIQKFMHSALKVFPAFEFIGSPDTPEKIGTTFSTDIQDGEEYVSGDYSAATDNLRSNISEMVWSAICDKCQIDDTIRQLGTKCLTQHVLFRSKQDPKWKTETEGVEQRNGQSMGSPMSFPILCLTNLACWSLAYGWKGSQALRGPVRVNGDDIVFSGKIDLYDGWWRINKYVGFNPSKGKNYRSSRFLNINSHTYLRSSEGNWERVPVVNLAIVQNMVRKGPDAGQTSRAPWFMVKPAYDQLVEGFSLRVQENLRDIFRAHVRLPDLPIDLPTRCGGPGLSVHKGGVEVFSDEARMMSSLFMTSKQRDRFLRRKPSLPDDSEVGEALCDWSSTRQMKVSYSGDKVAFPKPPEDGGMCAGDVLGVLLMAQTDSYMRNKQNIRSVQTGTSTNHTTAQKEEVYDNPRFVRTSEEFERSLLEFYRDERIFGRFFHLISGCVSPRMGVDLAYGVTETPNLYRKECLGIPDWEGLHLADHETCATLNLNWMKRVVTWDMHAIRQETPQVTFPDEIHEVCAWPEPAPDNGEVLRILGDAAPPRQCYSETDLFHELTGETY